MQDNGSLNTLRFKKKIKKNDSNSYLDSVQQKNKPKEQYKQSNDEKSKRKVCMSLQSEQELKNITIRDNVTQINICVKEKQKKKII